MSSLSMSPPRIEQADYREFLAGLRSGSVDLLLTDPPYGISRETGFANVKNGVERFGVSMDFGAWDHEAIDLDALAAGVFDALRVGGTAIIWFDLWKLSELRSALEGVGFRMFRQIIWEKTNPVPLNASRTYLSNSRELAVVCVKGSKPTFHGYYDKGVYAFGIPRFNGKRIHATQKPVELFAELINKHSNPGDLVLDPFLGSGTTAVAAQDSNRRFIGCDIDEHYVNAARKRVANG